VTSPRSAPCAHELRPARASPGRSPGSRGGSTCPPPSPPSARLRPGRKARSSRSMMSMSRISSPRSIPDSLPAIQDVARRRKGVNPAGDPPPKFSRSFGPHLTRDQPLAARSLHSASGIARRPRAGCPPSRRVWLPGITDTTAGCRSGKRKAASTSRTPWLSQTPRAARPLGQRGRARVVVVELLPHEEPRVVGPADDDADPLRSQTGRKLSAAPAPAACSARRAGSRRGPPSRPATAPSPIR
jgi:hypothetical protein